MTQSQSSNKLEVLAPLQMESAAVSVVSKALNLPPEEERQPDLQYLTAIFVSSGINKNGAVFLGSELLKARRTIVGKAVDLEHAEQQIIGQITNSVFLKRDKTLIDPDLMMKTMMVGDQDQLDLDIGISAIIHKARFPELAAEVARGEWMVSMECFYRDYDIKVGNMIIPKEQAADMGIDGMIGSVVRVKDGDKELGFHLVGRVLRDILFSGVGLVKNPANPRSIIMESAAVNEYIQEKSKEGDVLTLNINDFKSVEFSSDDSKDSDMKSFIYEVVTSAVDAAFKKNTVLKEEAKEPLNHITPGTCVNYKRYVYTYPDPQIVEPDEELTQIPMTHPPGPQGVESPGAEIAREHWCNLFDLDCTARPGDATLPDCWRNVYARTVKEEVFSHEEVLRRRRVQEGLVSLQSLLDDAKKF